MRIVFFGTGGFGIPSLERLFQSGHEVVGVVTQPDRKKGRHLKLAVSPVKEAALKLDKGIKIFQPEVLSEDFASKIRELKCDLFVVAAYGNIMKKEILDIPRLYSVNLHPSLLPKYRGAAPVNWAIINGEKETGLTIIKMDERMDAGDIILQRSVEIQAEDTSESLNRRLSMQGAVLLLDAIRLIKEDRVTFKKQNEKKATLAPRLKKEDGIIDWKRSAVEIHNKVRGTIPWPGAYTYFGDKKINIWKTTVLEDEGACGEVLEAKDKLIVGTKKGLLRIEEIQVQGKRRMKPADFLRGFRALSEGSKFRV